MSDQSLERALDDNTKAILDLTDVIAAIVKSAPASRSRKAADKEGDKPPARGPGRPRNADKDKGGDKEPTLDDIHKAFGDYLAVKDEDEYDKRADFVKSISDEFGVTRLSEASDEDFRQAYKWLIMHQNGERVRFDDRGGEGDRGRDGDRSRDRDRGGDRDRGEDRSRDRDRGDDRGRDRDRGEDRSRDRDRGDDRSRDRGRDDDRRRDPL